MKHTLKNGKTVNIRPTCVDDAQQLVNLFLAVDAETKFLGRNVGEFDADVQKETAFLQKTVNSATQKFYVAEIDGQIVGQASFALIRNRQRFVHRAELGITVMQPYWGNGIGSLLLQTMHHEAKQMGIEQMELYVVTTNTRAIALYEKFGYLTYGTVPHALKYPDGSYADEYFMIKTL